MLKVLVTQTCPTLCHPMDCSPPGSSVHGMNPPGRNSGVGSHSLLQRIFSTQKLNLDPGLLYCRWIIYHLSHQESLYFHTRYWVTVKTSLSKLPHPIPWIMFIKALSVTNYSICIRLVLILYSSWPKSSKTMKVDLYFLKFRCVPSVREKI